MIVVTALKTDAKALSKLHAQGFNAPWSEKDLSDMIERSVYNVVLARSSATDDPLAFGVSQWAGDDVELVTLVSATSQRRKGLAKSIFARLDKNASEQDAKRWLLEVAKDNEAAIELYKQLGFSSFSTRKAYYKRGNARIDALMMEREIGGIRSGVDKTSDAAHTGTGTGKG